MSSLQDILVSAQSGNQNTQQKSLLLLSQELHSNPSNLLLHLTQLLSNPSVPLLPRHLSGIYLKNSILNPAKDPQLRSLWQFLPQNTKQQIKNSVLAMLADDFKDLRQISSQIIAVISKIDLPSGDWPDLLNILLINCLNVNPIYRETSLMTLGNICEIIEENIFAKEQSDSILTALFSGLSENEKSAPVVRTALSGLRNSLRFFKANIMHLEEREVLFNVIFKLCVDERPDIRKSAMDVLCEIAALYYDFLGQNLIDLGNLTYNAINRDELPVALMAVEFWCIIGQTESEREEAKIPHKGYLMTAAASLTPILLSKMHLFEEDEGIAFQNYCAPALKYIAMVVKDPVVDYVYTYISANLTSNDLNLMKSAAIVFGKIMKGPSLESLSHLVKSSVDSLRMLLQHREESIRECVSWCLSTVLNNIKNIREFIDLTEIITSISNMLSDCSKILKHGLACLNSVAENNEICQMIPRETIEDLFSLIFKIFINDFPHSTDALTALSELIKNSQKECVPFFEKKLSQFIDLLESTPVKLQESIIDVVYSIYTRMNCVSVNKAITDRLVQTLISIVDAERNLIESAVELLAYICEKMGSRFENYIKHVLPVLLWGLEDFYAASSCKSCITCVIDIARTLNFKFTPYVQLFIPRFILILSNESVNLLVKIEAINALSEFCMIPGAYQQYCSGIMQYIDSASEVCRKLVEEDENPDLFDAVNILRESILYFYISLIIGLRETNSIELIRGRIEDIVSLCVTITQDSFKSSHDTHFHAAGLIGDLAASGFIGASYVLRSEPVFQFLNKSSQSASPSIRSASDYSLRLINSI